jgi:superfamily II DNA or RNA helicase
VVAPPGSGKTLLGVEVIRRLGAPALVLAPNTAVQAQWPRAVARFGGADVVSTSPGAFITCLTYQSLCRVDDPDGVLAEAAAHRWAVERAAALGEDPAAVAADAETWTGAAARRRAGELARITAALKRSVARGEHDSLTLSDLLTPGARERIAALRDAGVGTVVLDECHHLASLWGYLVQAVLAELGDEVRVVGLTATPPAELTSEEAELYETLLGPVDFTVPTPAVVRDGFLAPFQELAWFTEPLQSEQRWLAEHDVRFAELVTQLHDLSDRDALSFPEWVITRVRTRGRAREDAGEAAEVPWERFQKARPALARAAIRFLLSAGLEVPGDAPRGEGYRRPPDLEDWLVLLEDYALRCLAPDPSPEAAGRYEAIAAALRDLGFTLTRRGLRRGTSHVDRLLTASAAKPLALCEVLATESEVRGDALRALVLCDAERASAAPDPELRGVLDADAGTAVRALHAIAADPRTAILRPLLVTGRALRCHPQDADTLLKGSDPFGDGATGLRVEGPDADGLMRVVADGEAWAARRWVGLATEALRRGDVHVLVGTRALLGEGWDAPSLNVLVDMTTAATGVSVRQMRGRTLRLDPGDPEKLASNWDIVCVAPGLARGAADYERFVRKHTHLLAPAEDGLIEAGVSHVHPELSPFGPPPAEDFPEINRAMRERAGDHLRARRLWAIGSGYAGRDQTTLVVRARRGAAPVLRRDEPPAYPVSQRGPVALAGAGVAGALAGVLAGAPEALALLAATPVGAGIAAARLGAARDRLPAAVPLDLAARAVAEALAAVGDLSEDAARSLVIEPRTSGYLRCRLAEAGEEESAAFAAALDEVLGPVGAPRYLVSRLVAPPGVSRARLVARTLAGRPAFTRRWHAVPSALGNRKERAEAFHAAWRRWLGPSELRFTHRTDEGRRLRAEAAAQQEHWDVQRRDAWV